MKLNYSLLFALTLNFLIVATSAKVVITTRRNYYANDTTTIDIAFSIQQFKNLYECLCGSTTDICSVEVTSCFFNKCSPINIDKFYSQDQPNDHPPCKYYLCFYSLSLSSFICSKKELPICDNWSRTQSMHYRSANCDTTHCVSITWAFPEEQVDYSDVIELVNPCSYGCGCSAGRQSTAVRTTPKLTLGTPTAGVTLSRLGRSKKAKKRPSTTKTTTRKTPSTTTKTTILKTTSIAKITTQPTTEATTLTEPPSQTTVTVVPTAETMSQGKEETTSQGKEETTSQGKEETMTQAEELTTDSHTTASGMVPDSQTQNNQVPIIVGLVVASVLVASFAVVAAFLWKRKKASGQKPAFDCHEYVNLPHSSGRVKGFEAPVNLVNSNGELSSQFTNYAIANGSFHYDNDEATYVSLTNQTNNNTVHTNNQTYVNYENRESGAEAPKVGNQAQEAGLEVSGGYVVVTNTLEETDDFTNSVYELANPNLESDPELADVSSSTSKTISTNQHSQKRTNEPKSNTTAATVTTESHPYENNTFESDSNYPTENTYQNTEPSIDLQTLENTTNPLNDYEFATQTTENVPAKDSTHSVSFVEVDSETTYSLAANPASDRGEVDKSRPHVYAHLGQEKPNIVNPYNELREKIEAPVPRQPKLQHFNHGKDSDSSYSVAEPILESQLHTDNDYPYEVIDSTNCDSEECESVSREVYLQPFEELNKSSSYQRSEDNVYFELEK